MPVTQRAWERELKAAGYSVERTNKGHYIVKDAFGNPVSGYAVGHGRNKGLVLDSYVNKIRKLISKKE